MAAFLKRLFVTSRRSSSSGLTLFYCCLCLVLMLQLLHRRTSNDNSENSDWANSLTKQSLINRQSVRIVYGNNKTSSSHTCSEETLFAASNMETRIPWQEDEHCSNYNVSYLVPGCRKPFALASYPGSGNTWIRYLLEGAGGIFTGSRYKDILLQMNGFWGEIRDWRDGTTIVQKTHDASQKHVQDDFFGRGILIVRNPYDAILSTHNFLYGGHHGNAPKENFRRKEWEQFVTIQMSKWLDMVKEWTKHGENVLVLHYENVKSNPSREIKKALLHLGLPIDEQRIDKCMAKHLNGYFRRKARRDRSSLVTAQDAFPTRIRSGMDQLIDLTSEWLRSQDFAPLPTDQYRFYRKSDQEVLRELEREDKVKNMTKEDVNENEIKNKDKGLGARMLLKNYFKWLDSEDKRALESGVNIEEDLKTQLLRQFFQSLKKAGGDGEGDGETGLPAGAEGLLEKAVELWPVLSKPFKRDKIDELIENDGHRGKSLEDLKQRYF